MYNTDVLIVGGGAAGFFTAINIKEKAPHLKVVLLEKTRQLLSKVKISGGGRCNVTHACYDIKKLAESYPRGKQELLGPFSRFQPLDTIRWFEERGVKLKTEEDGRMFPITDSSETIIACFYNEAKKLDIQIICESAVEKIEPGFLVHLRNGDCWSTSFVVLATGGSPQGYDIARSLGHTVVSPVPSLFTFNCPTSPFLDLSGIALEKVHLKIEDSSFEETGPLLLTHWGFSGPAILKLSSFAAVWLHERHYKATLTIDWMADPALKLPKNLSKRLLEIARLVSDKKLSKKDQDKWMNILHHSSFNIEGETTYKQEFVTAGGIDLKEINFKTMESKKIKNLFFAGEILNIDGITGGFNFQNAWTSSWLISTFFASPQK